MAKSRISVIPARLILKCLAALGLATLILAVVLPVIWTDSYPVRIFSASMVIAGAGILMFGLPISQLLKPGSRAKEFTFIGSGMVGMAMLIIGVLTLVEVNRLI